MAHLKLDFEEEFEEPYALVAIHCSEEEYKLAYLLNLHLGLRLARRKTDLDFKSEEGEIAFPIYDFEDVHHHDSYQLVANKCRSVQKSIVGAGDLFGEESVENSNLHYLFPEFKKIDYFLKIFSDFESSSLQDIISKISQINEVVSAYAVEFEEIKSKNNLIFD
ncbi:IPExxxVDY family protein [Aequorivita sp. H23M31]|uniref:IPExxxVDY family protein n=1 Tax=Aequorivita ciconiae TaxID=2494375 RepID=A0A410G5C0_9FLAO|nr:IPExxxVDY family protein [Aequorivita sp. H23M31]QAA82421.1 IPExxxVDY family protein [Aequorivita sp. H23M31]